MCLPTCREANRRSGRIVGGTVEFRNLHNKQADDDDTIIEHRLGGGGCRCARPRAQLGSDRGSPGFLRVYPDGGRKTWIIDMLWADWGVQIDATTVIQRIEVQFFAREEVRHVSRDMENISNAVAGCLKLLPAIPLSVTSQPPCFGSG